jgi:two-component system cell cycle sensor histidine kinase/response regulator CckA
MTLMDTSPWRDRRRLGAVSPPTSIFLTPERPVATPKSNRKAGGAQKTPRKARTPASPRKTPAKTILLVEDDADVRSSTKRMLEKLGYRVLDTATADEAFNLLAQPNTPADLVLTDIVMRGMSGRELAVRLSIERPGLQVLLMSGYSADTMHLQEDEVAHFVRKPFSMEFLAKRVKHALEGN